MDSRLVRITLGWAWRHNADSTGAKPGLLTLQQFPKKKEEEKLTIINSTRFTSKKPVCMKYLLPYTLPIIWHTS